MAIKAVAFDMGGVIARNTGGNILEAIAQMISVPAEDFKREYWTHNHLSNVENMTWEDMIIRVVAVFNNDDAMRERIRKFVREYEASRMINQELVSWFAQLHAQGLKVAIFSNATTELRAKLEQFEIAPLVDAIVISGEIGHQKPDKEAFDVLFEQLGVRPEETVFIDDSPKSLETAGEIGYTPILYKSNEQVRGELAKLGIIVR